MDAEDYGEPWRYAYRDSGHKHKNHATGKSTPIMYDAIVDKDGKDIVSHPDYDIVEMPDEKQMRRIVACVNACRFLPTEQLESADRALISVVPK